MGASGGWPQSGNSSFGNGGPRPSQPRSVTVRLMVCQVFKNLEGTTADGYHDVSTVKDQVNLLYPTEVPVTEKEVLDICETEGSPSNGGGNFDIRDENGRHSIKYEIENSSRSFGAGEIGSPIVRGSSRFVAPPGF